MYIHWTFFCQNASVWNRFQLYIDDKGKLWVTNAKKGGDKKQLDADTNQGQKQIPILNKQKKSNH